MPVQDLAQELSDRFRSDTFGYLYNEDSNIGCFHLKQGSSFVVEVGQSKITWRVTIDLAHFEGKLNAEIVSVQDVDFLKVEALTTITAYFEVDISDSVGEVVINAY